MNQFCLNSGEEHWIAAKRILRYILGTMDHGIGYHGNKESAVKLKGFVDSDWGTNPNGRKSQSGYVSWASKRQPIVILSSTEAKYIAASLSSQELIWISSLLNGLNFKQDEPTILNEDNQGTISLSTNPKNQAKTKHIDIEFHFIREKIKNCEIQLEYCPSEDMIADMLTKPFGRVKYKKFRDLMCVTNGLLLWTVYYMDFSIDLWTILFSSGSGELLSLCENKFK